MPPYRAPSMAAKMSVPSQKPMLGGYRCLAPTLRRKRANSRADQDWWSEYESSVINLPCEAMPEASTLRDLVT